MKLLAKLVLLGLVAMSQSAWAADAGPFYVKLTGFCDVKKVYLKSNGDVYGTEVGCSKYLGQTYLGFLLNNGVGFLSSPGVVVGGNGICQETFSNGVQSMSCSDGRTIDYYNNSRYTIQQLSKPSTAGGGTVSYDISTEMPDLDAIKDLPSRR